jgi:rhodanese-related sulfurtransferase
MPVAVFRDDVRRLVEEEGAQLVEVLLREEYEEEHLPRAINIPLKEVPSRLASFILQLVESEGGGDLRRLQGTHPLHPSAAGDHDRLQARDRDQGLHPAPASRDRRIEAAQDTRQGC